MDYKYIKSIPPPLLNDFVKNRVVPIVGAGFSKNADIPKGLSLPDWNELGRIVAKEIPGYDYNGDAIDALSYYEELFTRPSLVELLVRELHHGEIQPGKTIQAFCNFFSGTICTTNFDTLLEDAMVQSHHPASIIVTEDRLTVGSSSESKIIKIHGDFNHPDKMVITERDFDVFLEQNPVMATYIANLFITNTMLLIGYSLDDNDLRGIWQLLHSRLGKMSRPAYCLTVGASEQKRIRYQRRNIMVVNLNGDPKDYKQILKDFFEELKNYCSEMIPTESKNDKVNEQLMIPAENNRLCFISCSYSRIARLSSFLYPTLINIGVTPVRLDDMLLPGDNWVITAESLMQKSRAAIIDVTDANQSVMFELRMILSNPQLSRDCIIICEHKSFIPYDVRNRQVLRYSLDKDYSDSINSAFIKDLQKWCIRTYKIPTPKDMAETGMNSVFKDAHRLFEKAEYSACILAAYSSLEEYAKETLLPRTAVFSSYLRKDAFSNHEYERLISPEEIYRFVALRNQIAHGQHKATNDEAMKFMELAKKVANILKKISKNRT